MKIAFRLSHKALIIVAVPLLFELVFLATLTTLLKRAEYEIWRERHSKAVISESNALLKNFVDSGFALYMYGSTGADAFLERYKELSYQIQLQIRSLKIMIRDSPNQKESLVRLEMVTNHATEILARTSQLVNDGRAAHRFSEEKAELESMLSDLTSQLRMFVKEQEKAEQVDPQAEAQSRILVMQCLVVGVFLNIVVAVFLAIYFNRGITKRLHVLMENTERLLKGQSLHERVSGGDEVARLDDVFHQMAEALAEAARRKQELMSMVSHDLRTPLTSVHASLTLLSEGVFGQLPARVLKEIITAENNTTRLIGLINDLLDIEKIEAGQLRVELKESQIDLLFERSIEAVKAFADKQCVKVEIEFCGLVVYADPERVIQILVNLISNAIKFSPPESTVKLCALSRDGMVVIQVIDKGRGVPAKLKNAIFERFQQVEVADAKEKNGTGLGLTICKSLVELQGGRIGVESEEGFGSTFWFALPMTKAMLPVARHRSAEKDYSQMSL